MTTTIQIFNEKEDNVGQENARNYEKPVVETTSPHQSSAGVAVGTAATVAVDPLNIVNPIKSEGNGDDDKQTGNPAVLSITTEPKQLLGKDVCDRAVVNAAIPGKAATFDVVPLLGPPKQEKESTMNEDNKKETLNPTSTKKEKENCFTTSLSCCIDTLDCTIM